MALPSADEIAPLPGSASNVRAYANKYADVAAALTSAASELTSLIADSTTGLSDAVDALVEVSGDVADRLSRLHDRYATAGSALGDYATELSEARTTAATAVSNRDTAVSEMATAQYWVDHYQYVYDHETDAALKDEAFHDLTRWRGELEGAEALLYSARQAYQAALTQRDDAAEVARQLISGAIDSDGLNDSMWDNFSGWVSEHAELLSLIKNILSGIAAVLAIASLFFPVLAPFALVFAGAAALMSFVLSATGNQSWIDFAVDFISFATLGVGAIAGNALKGTMALLKSTRVLNVAQTATTKNPLRVVTGSFNGVMPARTTLLGKLNWAKEIFGAKGLQNAQTLRILNGARAGSGGPADALLVNLAHMQVSVSQGAAAVSSIASKADSVLGNSGLIGDVLGSTLPDSLDGVAGVFDSVGDWYEGAKADSTFRLGSGW